MKKIFSIFLFTILIMPCFGQKRQAINLYDAFVKDKIDVVNRQIQGITDNQKRGIRLSENKEEGLAWLKGIHFSEGTIEFDVRGKDVFQQSFVGIAFHGQNDSTYEAIYFRPFNFYAKDSVRFIHAVQYIAHPTFTWKKLREERNGQFEKAIPKAPNPNDWFHAKVVITSKNVAVFINNKPKAVLNVERLTAVQTGKIGIFVGDGSGGDFANLVVVHP